MASGIHRLSAIEVQNAKYGDHNDGGGLVLRVRGASASWVLRFTSPAGVRREMGLGVAYRGSVQIAGKSAVNARDAAEQARRLLRDGRDPIHERDRLREEAKARQEAAKRQKQAERATLARVAREYHERVIEPNRTEKHSANWIASLENHVPEKLWHAPIDGISGPQLLDAIAELQARIPETASRIRQRLDAIFDDAEFRGLCSGNPARAIRRKLREAMKGKKRGRRQFAALPYAKAPAFMADLRKREGIAARALEFAILTAARTSEVLGAVWSEFDVPASIWRVPAVRMKRGEEHMVYLPARALEIIAEMRQLGSAYVFPSPLDPSKALSQMGMLVLLRRMDASGETTVHGIARSTLSTWANETGAARPDVVEACLAHREQDRIRAAYNRAQFAAERRSLLQAWADYLDGKEAQSNIVELPRTRVA